MTGANLKQLMLKVGKDCIENLVPNDAFTIDFAPIPQINEWKIPIVKEILDVKSGEMHLPGEGLSFSEIDEILKFLTTS